MHQELAAKKQVVQHPGVHLKARQYGHTQACKLSCADLPPACPMARTSV